MGEADDRKWALLAVEFPSSRTATHFDHASVGPISLRVSNAMVAVSRDYAEDGFQFSWRDDIEVVRGQAATLVGSDIRNIAFTQNTSTGLSVAANGLDWRPGDNVVLSEREFPSNYYPWMNLERRGVEVRRVPAPAGNTTIEALRDAIDERTRIVTVTPCTSRTAIATTSPRSVLCAPGTGRCSWWTVLNPWARWR
jgi:selenocysteine lyase/cysteine desulfurase